MALRQLIYMREIPFRIGGLNHINYSQNKLVLFRQLVHKNVNIVQKHQLRSSLIRNNNNISNPFERIAISSGPIKSSSLWKSFIFSIAFSTGSFISVTIWEYEILRAKALRSLKNSIPFGYFKSKLHNGQRKMQIWQNDVNSWWNQLSPGEQIFAPICALNILIFGLWRVPKLQPMMVKYFCSNPVARAVCWPMVLSTFSHYSLFHIFANMFVLHSFANIAVSNLGKEQFLGLYLSAGVFSSFASHLYKGLTGRAGLSLGASGAIMGVLGYVCSQYPNTQLSILFLPMFHFSAGTAIKCIMGIDLAGAVLGWKIFDHAAHLGGAIFGLFWCYFGSIYVWPKREVFLKFYHQIRTPPK